jgi:hypothetical protein
MTKQVLFSFDFISAEAIAVEDIMIGAPRQERGADRGAPDLFANSPYAAILAKHDDMVCQTARKRLN